MPEQRHVCTQYQIRYTCGHSLNSEFIKCPAHAKKDDQRCPKGTWEYKVEKVSSHLPSRPANTLIDSENRVGVDSP